MEYKWNKLEILKIYNNLLKISKNKNNFDKRLYKSLITYKYILSGYNRIDLKNTFLKNNFNDYSISDLDFLIKYLNDIDKDSLIILDRLITVYPLLFDYNNESKIEYKKIKFSYAEILEYCIKIYKSTDNKKLYSFLIKEILNKKNVINFKNSLDKSTFGYYFYDSYNDLSYIDFNIHNNINDLITLPHEGMHMYYRKTLNMKHSNMFKEVEGNFMEFISKHYLIQNNIYKNEVIKLDINYNQIITNICFYIFMANHLINTLDKDGNFNYNDLCISENRNIFINLDYNAMIINSYLSAIDLYKKYTIDKEKAFYNLDKLKYSNEPNLLKRMEESEITFFEDNYHNLNLYLKKLEKRKKFK